MPEDPRHSENILKKLGVKQIYNESSKIANPLYIKLSPPLPDSFSTKAISNKIISTCQKLIFTGFKKIIKCYNVVCQLLNTLENGNRNLTPVLLAKT